MAQMNFTDQIYVDQTPNGLEGIKDGSQLPEDMAIHMDLREVLYRNLEKLPDLPKKLLKMRYFQDMSVTETASLLGLAEGTVKSRLSRGRERLRKLLEGRV